MKVVKHQLHMCSPQQCGGPAPLGQQCKHGFPRPYSPVTYYKSEQLLYVTYIVVSDQWVHKVPNFTDLWCSHECSICHFSQSGKISHKVCIKTRPTHIFNVTDGDKYQEHVVARHLGSMECIFLLLGERICNSSIVVKYLTTEMLNTRSDLFVW